MNQFAITAPSLRSLLFSFFNTKVKTAGTKRTNVKLTMAFRVSR